MKRAFSIHRVYENEQEDKRSFSELLTITLKLILKKYELQERWFDTNHYAEMVNGELQSKESHNDYHLMALLYENVTQDREKLRQLFEASPYFKSKDYKHMMKWKHQDYRYYNYQFNKLSGRKKK